MLYAILLGWPGQQEVVLKEGSRLMDRGIRSVKLLGYHAELVWRLSPEGLGITLPTDRVDDMAIVFKIE